MNDLKNSVIADIFSYDDFRTLLNNYIEQEVQLNSNFSKRSFAKKCGFTNHSSLLYILSGRRNATPKSVKLLLKGLGLNEKDEQYFRVLVNFTQTTSRDERATLFKKMNKLRKNILFRNVKRSQLSFYENWHNAVIRELVISSDWNGDFEKLGKYVSPPIKAKDAEKSFNLLIELGMIVEENGEYFAHATNITPSTEIPILYLKQARNDLFLEAIRANDRYSPKERYYDCITMDVCQENYDKIRELTDKYFQQVLELTEVSPKKKKSRIFQLNLQLFPLSTEYPRC